MCEAARESQRELLCWMTWCRKDYSRADALAFVLESGRSWDKRERFYFAIVDAGDGRFLGSVGLSDVNPPHGVCNAGYWVRKSAGGRGAATTAVQLAARFAFETLRLNRIEFLIAESNIASQKVAQKAGAKFEGLLRQRLILAGRRYDAALYSLLPADLV